MTTIRSFIAIELPADSQAALTGLQNWLKPQVPPRSVRWAAPPNIHLTLHFLGNVTEPAVEKIAAAVADCAAGCAPFSLELTGLGCFPNNRRPRIVWVGVGGDTGPLVDLHQTLGQALDQATGFAPETRPYAPHLTIGRVKKGLPKRQLAQVGRVLEQEQTGVSRLATLEVAQISLIKSELQPTGAVYTPLVHGRLAG